MQIFNNISSKDKRKYDLIEIDPGMTEIADKDLKFSIVLL